MTRETKIGLLVGLAFILIIGILLSEHVTRSMEPPQATLVQAADTVRQGVQTPGITRAPQPPITTVRAPGEVAPQMPVPTQQELTRPVTPPIEQIIQVVPAEATPTAAGSGPSSIATGPQPTSPMAGANLPVVVGSGEPPVTMIPQPTPTPPTAGTPAPDPATPWGDFARVAEQAGAPVIVIGAPERPAAAAAANPVVASDTRKPAVESAPPAPNGVREYVVEPGDNLHRVAVKTMGASTKANRDAIVRLNPSLQQNPNVLVVGQRYLVPAIPGLSPAKPAAGSTASAKPATPAAAKPAETVLYEVKAGDSLWKIAVEQTGSPNGMKLIKQLNADVLRGGDSVQTGMKLRIPRGGDTRTAKAD